MAGCNMVQSRLREAGCNEYRSGAPRMSFARSVVMFRFRDIIGPG